MAKNFKGYKGYGGKRGSQIVPQFDMNNLLEAVDLSEATDIIIDAYHNQGYNGEFGRTSHFIIDTKSSKNPVISFLSPEYTPYMLYGRGPGKTPPIEPIRNWMNDIGMTGNPWGIAISISKYGTKGNDFISPILSDVTKSIENQIQYLITQALSAKI